ncbi:Gfo/Idh/MocA family protein [Actinoplanes sp. DH11]|uniref:Gfo/Idh/MocA family protein n=1 Tax=Actinoplanes sp. DH11 TaxID=2857011 RepID=UPI001E52DC96|nr:Gfo/Idh/MocA family oxidoreductase [Actinoplanes sp. DH11]
MRFGLLGTGPWAHQAHAPGLAAHPEVEFTGVWGRDPGKADELAGKFGTRAYADVDALLADVDAVAIALPPDVQAEMALRAARAGKHLLLDKPVALLPEQARAVADACAAGDLASVVFFTRRFSPELSAFIAETAAVGGWTEARVDHLGSIFESGSVFGASPWRRERGGLWDVGPHALALVLPVLGPVTDVAAMAGARDLIHLVLRHEGGATSRLTLAVDAPAASAREEAVFAGEAGLRTVPRVQWKPDAALGRAVDELLAAAAGGTPSACDARFGAGVTAVLAAAERAVRDGVTVHLTA